MEPFAYYPENKRKNKTYVAGEKTCSSAHSGWWTECLQGMITVFSSELFPVLHFLPHWWGAQDKSQQAETLATCQMLHGLWLPALWIWLATLAGSHLLFNQHFLFKMYFTNSMVGLETPCTFDAVWGNGTLFFRAWLGCSSWVREVLFTVYMYFLKHFTNILPIIYFPLKSSVC